MGGNGVDPVREALASLLGAAPVELAALAGGDIGDSWRVRDAADRVWFVKSYERFAGRARAADMVAAEAHGLAWLAEAGELRIPALRAVPDPGVRGPSLLVLEWIEPGPRAPAFDEKLGRGLARLHRLGAPTFGLDRDGYIGRLPQTNDPAGTWVEFYALRRLEPLLRQARDRDLLSAASLRRGDELLKRLPGLVGPPEPPARLHGDLWGGNLLVTAEGDPCLIDPAAYGGHREVDLAMMRLFGGFSSRVFDAYDEEWPLEPEAPERVPLYQLYPLLVHLLLFGGGYAGSVDGTLRRYT